MGTLCRKHGRGNDPKHTSSVIYGGGSVVAWACKAVYGTQSLGFIDDLPVDRCSRMNSVVYKARPSAQTQSNAAKTIEWRCTVQMDNDPKYITNTTQELFKEFFNGQVSHLIWTWLSLLFNCWRQKLKGERPTNNQQLKAFQSISRKENLALGDTHGFQTATYLCPCIKNNRKYVSLFKYFWVSKKWRDCVKIVVIPKQLMHFW